MSSPSSKYASNRCLYVLDQVGLLSFVFRAAIAQSVAPRWRHRGEGDLVLRLLQQKFPRSQVSSTVLILPPLEFSQGIVHGFSTAIEIALLGRFGEPLEFVFDETP